MEKFADEKHSRLYAWTFKTTLENKSTVGYKADLNLKL